MAQQEKKIAIIGHAYNPDRYGARWDLRGKSTSIDGVNHTLKVADRSYDPLARLGIPGKISYTYAMTLARQLQDHRPETAAVFEANFANNGVGSPAIHSILPHRDIDDKRILVGAGLEKGPSTEFWAPEGTYDNETIEVLTEFGVKAFVCRPDGIVLDKGGDPENIPVRITLPNGRTIVALPFDRHVSNKLGMDPKENADQFSWEHIQPRLNGRPIISITDIETFGEHWPFADLFLDHLVSESLRGHIIPLRQVDLSDAQDGRLEGITSWSCFHNAERWKGPCPCHEDDVINHGADLSWKRPYFEATTGLNDEITKLVRPELGRNYVSTMVRDFERALYNPGIQETRDEELAVKSAKASGLANLTSCPTFFPSIYVTGLVNLMMARQAVLHLNEAGFSTDSRRIEEGFKTSLERVRVNHPYTAEMISGVQIYEDLVGEQTLLKRAS